MPLIISPSLNMLVALLLSFSLSLAESTLTSTVKTNNGFVQGEILRTVLKSTEYSSFKGIPYAKPPVGYLRFKPPVPVDSWNETLLATKEGHVCPQINFIFESNLIGDEDCLYLNVYTPEVKFDESATNLRTVMVWIYGGYFKDGYSNSSYYGPDYILEEDVVLVTFNYRLGPLGFLSLNHPNATGNAGLKDQNLVLKWVQANIAKFGGNPDKVTIFGQSAGGIAVEYHMLSDMSESLFYQTISMSASVFDFWGFQTPMEAVNHAFTLGGILGTAATTKEAVLQTLYEAPAYDLLLAAKNMTQPFNTPFKPTLEDPEVAPNKNEVFLSKCSYLKITSRNFTRVPHLMGFAANEVIDFIPTGALSTLESAQSYLRSLYESIFHKSNNLLSTETLESAILSILNELSDILFVAGIDLKQRLLHTYGSQPIYYYKLSFDTKYSLHRLLDNIQLNGTSHGDDMAYLFHMTVVDIPFQSDVRLANTRDRMVRMWTNFAKYGNPTPNGTEDTLLNIVWPESGSSGKHLEINDDLTVGDRPIDPRVYLYELGTEFSAITQKGCFLPFSFT